MCKTPHFFSQGNDMKTCTKCGETKAKTEFYLHKHTKDKLASLCKHCYKLNEQRWKEENPEAYKLSCRRRNLKKKFGITIEEYMRIYDKQQGKCACCGEEKPSEGISGLVVDHSHTSGEVRELLCTQCNTALGLLKENADIVNKLLEYIRKHNG